MNELKYETYDNYVDTNFDLIKNVPYSFRNKRIKDFINYIQTGTTPSSKDVKTKENLNLNWFGPSDLNKGELFNSEKKINQYSLDSKQVKLINEPCVLFSIIGEIGKIGYSLSNTTTNQQISSIVPNKDIFLKYLYYLLIANKDYIKSYSKETVIFQLNNNTLININNFFIPSKKEQLSIVKFLDSKTSIIDKKISLLEEQNRLNEELEKSIINQCVTKGVDSFTKLDKNGNLIDFDNIKGLNKEDFDVYMNENGYQNSDIEWIGYIPQNYNINKLKNLSEFRRGSFPQPYDDQSFYDEENGLPFVQVGDVDNNYLLKVDTKQHISKKAEPFSVFVPKNNLIMTIQGSIGKLAITQYDSYVDRTLLIFKSISKLINKKYLTFFLDLLFEEEKKQTIGGTILTINKERLSQFLIIFPLKKEQLEIVEFLDNKTSQLQKHRENNLKQIELLNEYKKTLINDVVTGKIKVTKD